MPIPKTATVPQAEDKLTIKQLAMLISELAIRLGEQLDSSQLSFGRLLTPQDVARRKIARKVYWDQYKEIQAMVELKTQTAADASSKKTTNPKQRKSTARSSRLKRQLPLTPADRESVAGRCVAYWYRLKRYAPSDEVPDLGPSDVTKSFMLTQNDQDLLELEQDFLQKCGAFAPLVSQEDIDACLAALQRGVNVAGLTLTESQRALVDRLSRLTEVFDRTRLLRDQSGQDVAELRSALEKAERRGVEDYLAQRRQITGADRDPQQRGDRSMADGERREEGGTHPELVADPGQDAGEVPPPDPTAAIKDDDFTNEVLKLRMENADLRAANNDQAGQIETLEKAIERQKILHGAARQLCDDYQIKDDRDFYPVITDRLVKLEQQIKQLEADKADLAQQPAIPASLVELSTKLGTTPEHLATKVEEVLRQNEGLTEEQDKLKQAKRLVDQQLGEAKANLESVGIAAQSFKADAEEYRRICTNLNVGPAGLLAHIHSLDEDREGFRESAERLDWWNRLIWRVALGSVIALVLWLGYTELQLRGAYEELEQAWADAAQAESQPAAATPQFKVYQPKPLVFED